MRDLCKHAVEGVRWEEVFVGEASSGATSEGWGEDGPDWHTWTDSYGTWVISDTPFTQRSHGKLTYNTEPDAGIVNFYQTKDTLMGHVDRSEVCATSPLVSISYVSFSFSGFFGRG